MDNKDRIIQHIISQIKTELNTLRNDSEGLQNALQNETKSSAGDKYETGREMITQEINKVNAQVNKHEKNLQYLKKINSLKTISEVTDSALVNSSLGLFFIGLPLGIIKIEKISVFCISGASPIYQTMKGLKAGDHFYWQNKKVSINSIT